MNHSGDSSLDKNNVPDITREFEGNDLEDAISSALSYFKLPREKIKIKILAEGTRGLFGMAGAKRAKIRATVMSESE
ncbi:MAG: Jag N-terminal domain-containing protein [Candidatus Omnitrophica bacterium]|nr:Jag N-terminal domain-containing protein [Candidatus Omnitrophota bacterium]